MKLNSGVTIVGRGIIRDSKGEMLFAFSTSLDEGTNNQVEMGIALFGLAWCIQLGYNIVILEVDSELLYKWIMRLVNPPWQLTQTLARL